MTQHSKMKPKPVIDEKIVSEIVNSKLIKEMLLEIQKK